MKPEPYPTQEERDELARYGEPQPEDRNPTLDHSKRENNLLRQQLAAEWEKGYQQGWEEGTFKAQQPLVDALIEVSSGLRGLGMAIPDVCDAIQVITRKINTALAKVKEGR